MLQAGFGRALSVDGAGMSGVVHESELGSPGDLEHVVSAYGSWAPAYIDLFGSSAAADDLDRTLIASWAGGVPGPVLDAGCGPGHWTGFLHGLGVVVEGVDAVPAFIAHARSTYPGVRFQLGDLRRVESAPGSLGGVLAWFSLIHLEPAVVPDVLRAFAAALRPQGSLLIGFFSGERLEPFDHRVVTAWRWPLERITEALSEAGLAVTDRRERETRPGRIAASVVARRAS